MGIELIPASTEPGMVRTLILKYRSTADAYCLIEKQNGTTVEHGPIPAAPDVALWCIVFQGDKYQGVLPSGSPYSPAAFVHIPDDKSDFVLLDSEQLVRKSDDQHYKGKFLDDPQWV